MNLNLVSNQNPIGLKIIEQTRALLSDLNLGLEEANKAEQEGVGVQKVEQFFHKLRQNPQLGSKFEDLVLNISYSQSVPSNQYPLSEKIKVSLRLFHAAVTIVNGDQFRETTVKICKYVQLVQIEEKELGYVRLMIHNFEIIKVAIGLPAVLNSLLPVPGPVQAIIESYALPAQREAGLLLD